MSKRHGCEDPLCRSGGFRWLNKYNICYCQERAIHTGDRRGPKVMIEAWLENKYYGSTKIQFTTEGNELTDKNSTLKIRQHKKDLRTREETWHVWQIYAGSNARGQAVNTPEPGEGGNSKVRGDHMLGNEKVTKDQPKLWEITQNTTDKTRVITLKTAPRLLLVERPLNNFKCAKR